MSQLPLFYIARHGETAWSVSGQHTGRTDIPLLERGERNALALAARLNGIAFNQVLSSPLQRAMKTCELAGFGSRVIPEPDAMEWNYGDYEGIKTVDIRKARPGWEIFEDGCPNGESLVDIAARADRLIARVLSMPGNTLLFSHGHFLRILGARWCGLPANAGRLLCLSTASVCALGYDHNMQEPAIRLWNDDQHVKA